MRSHAVKHRSFQKAFSLRAQVRATRHVRGVCARSPTSCALRTHTARCPLNCYCSLPSEQRSLPFGPVHLQAMASSSRAREHTHPAVSPFEHMLDKISDAYTGDKEEVDEPVNSFLDIAREIARDAGLVKAADGTGGSGQWQPNGNVSEEHLQAALRRLDSVRKVLEALNPTIDTAGWLEKYLVSTIHSCPTTSSLHLCAIRLISGIISRSQVC